MDSIRPCIRNGGWVCASSIHRISNSCELEGEREREKSGRNGRFVFRPTHKTAPAQSKERAEGSTIDNSGVAHTSSFCLSLSLSFFHLIFTLLFLPPESADSLPALSNLSLCFSLDPCFAGPSLKRSQKTHSCTSYCCFHFSAPPPISFSPPVRAE